MPKSSKSQVTQIIIILFIIIYGYILFKNIDFFPVPNTDILQYIANGKRYTNLQLPDVIHAPPANPILIGILSRVFKFSYKEIYIATSINIVSSVVSLYIIFLISNKLLKKYSLLLPILVSSTPIFISSALDIGSESLFMLCTVFVFYLMLTRRRKLAYLLSGLSFLVRYEGAFLILSILFVDLIRNKVSAKKIFSDILPATYIVVFWTIIISFKNELGTLFGNPYIQETINAKHLIPNFNMINYITKLSFPWKIYPNNIYFLLLLILYLGTGIYVNRKMISKNKWTIITGAATFTFLYTTIHVCFPYFDARYLVPILWIVYALLLWPFFLSLKKIREKDPRTYKLLYLLQISILLFSFSVLYRNLNNIKSDMAGTKYTFYEFRLEGEWLKNENLDENTYIIAVQAPVIKYYASNPKLHYVSKRSLRRCNNIECMISELRKSKEDVNIIIFTDSLVTHPDTYDVEPFRKLKTLLTDFEEKEFHNNFKLINHTIVGKFWFKAYKFIPREKM